MIVIPDVDRRRYNPSALVGKSRGLVTLAGGTMDSDEFEGLDELWQRTNAVAGYFAASGLRAATPFAASVP